MKSLMKIFLTVLIISLGIKLQAQNDSTIIRPFQLGFVTPLGTNGLQSLEVTNVVSLNLFAGGSGGVAGCELGGFTNYTHGDVKGVQVAGFGNTTMGSTLGAELAGFYNYNHNIVKGTQAAGFVNVITDSLDGIQIAGFSNVTMGSVDGIQAAGFSNYAQTQIEGLQMAGFANYAEDVSYGQAAGFVNVNHGNVKGAQVAGFANVSTNEVSGCQIAGFVNVTKKLNGTQIGIVNIADTIESGISVGIVNIVRNGYRKFEIGGTESLYGVASFKTGTEKFYNKISMGASVKDNRFIWGYGYGIGTMLPASEKMAVNFELEAYHISNNLWFTDQLNLLNKLNISTYYKLTESMSVFAGVSWNVIVSNVTDLEAKSFTPVVPWSVYEETRNNTTVKMYPGFRLGLTL